MKKGWEYKKLGDVANVIHGKNQKDVLSEDGQYPIYGSGGTVMGYATDYLCEAGTTILGRKGSINNPKFIEERFWNVDTAFGVTPKDDNCSKFIYYFITSIDWLSKNTGTTLPSLTQQVVKDVIIPIPLPSEQQSIVDYLDSAFAKIDAMKANAEKALNEAKALFQASLKEMLEPKEGWEEKALKDFATDMYRGSGVKRDQVTEEGISCVRYGEIYTKYNFHFSKCASHTLAEYVNSPKYFEYGDILFAITGESVEEIGKSIAYTGKEKCIAGGDIVVMKHNYEPRYISYALSTPSAIKQKGHGKTKLKVVHTNIPSLKEIILPIAPKDEQIKISDTLDSLKSKVDRLQENYNKISQECDALKQAILRQVFE